jgi:polyphosphate kinase
MKPLQEQITDRVELQIQRSKFISRDLSWIEFNKRVLDQARDTNRSIFERLMFLSITSSNMDEFFTIRVGSLYNYLDFDKERVDYSGLREIPFKKRLLSSVQEFFIAQQTVYSELLQPTFKDNGFCVCTLSQLNEKEKLLVSDYFMKTIFPMLTPMVYDSYHSFPILMNKLLIFGVVTKSQEDQKQQKKLSFVQIPQNIPRLFILERSDMVLFVPIEEIIRWQMPKLFRNIEILSVNLFRITRNGDFTLEESDDLEADFIEELKRKLKTRKTGRVVRIETDANPSTWMLKILKQRWELNDDNIFISKHLIDYTGIGQILRYPGFKQKMRARPEQVPPIGASPLLSDDIFEFLKQRDIMLHHPYNDVQPVLDLLEKSAEDPDVLAIKITIYRLAKSSRVTNALLKAAENGKHVSVLFELKARFDEENNIREAQRLQKAGCFVIFGMGSLKTHTKLMLIVRKDGDRVVRYVHLSSGNYNEDTAKLYTDVSLLSTNEVYAQDVSEFFNVITGHSDPSFYQNLITAPRDMRKKLIDLISQEESNAKKGKKAMVVIKINSLEDRQVIDALYNASQAGVQIRLIVRGICCLRPGRKGLSENIEVRSIVGDFLEHARLFYFYNLGNPMVYAGSADIMVRSFERRVESLFLILDAQLRKQAITILRYNLQDNCNAYTLKEDGSYTKISQNNVPEFNIHKAFFNLQEADLTLDPIPDLVKESA